MFLNLLSVIKKCAIAICLTLLCLTVKAQTPKQTAAEKYQQAIKLEDDGSNDDALKLLTEAQKLDPDNTTYPYEITYIYFNQKQYQKVIDVLEKLKDKPDSFDRLYQLLGNSYDNLDQHTKALAVYDEGLKRFPKSGDLYLGRGTILLDSKNYDEALKCFEKGIEIQPAYPDNYYWAAKLYCNSNEPMWGLLYGELFMNLERNGARTQEMSKLLFDTYKSQITFPTPGKAVVSFSFGKPALVDPSKPEKTPYGMIYEPTMGMAVAAETAININSLDTIRQNFLKVYFDKGYNKTYPNALFSYQDKISKAGCMEAYNHWLLFKGDEATFNTWRAQNPAKWQDFTKWYSANPLKLDDGNRFYRMQY